MEATTQGAKFYNALFFCVRWATHGVPSEVNSHPHTSGKSNEFIVVHNGIITNYKDVKLFLQVLHADVLAYMNFLDFAAMALAQKRKNRQER